MKFKNFAFGIIIGIGFIIPGVSGGVIATILGIYEEIIYRLNHFFYNIKSNIIYLLPLILGIIISIMLFSNIIIYLLNNNINFISYVFIGLILGCIPYLLKLIKAKTNHHLSLIPFVISFVFGIILFLFENKLAINYNNANSLTMIIAGLFYAIGKIIPGISGASLLMILGVYEFLLHIIANPLMIFNYNIFILLIPFVISFIINGVLLLKIIDYLFTYHFRITYSVIIGFVLSSILFIYPSFFSLKYLIVMILSFIISYNLSI